MPSAVRVASSAGNRFFHGQVKREPGAGNDFQARDTWTKITPVFSVLSRRTPPGRLCLTSMASRAILELRPETLLLHCRRSNRPGPGRHGGGSPAAAAFPPARRASRGDCGLRVQGHWLLAAAGPSGQLPEKNQARPSAPFLRPDLLTSLCFPAAAFCRRSHAPQLTRAVLDRSPRGSLSSCWGAAEGSTSVIIRRSGLQGWG